MLDIWPWDGEPNVVRQALGAGRVLAIPTESSYGLAVDPRSAAGVEAVYRLKERDRGKPLPVVAADIEQALDLGIERSEAVRLAERHWPAALTVVAPLRAGVSVPAAGARDTLAVRAPAHDRLRALLRVVGHPLTATSANRSGEPPACSVEELETLLRGADVLVVAGERTAGGPASTVVAWDTAGLRVLRRGRFEIPASAASGSWQPAAEVRVAPRAVRRPSGKAR